MISTIIRDPSQVGSTFQLHQQWSKSRGFLLEGGSKYSNRSNVSSLLQALSDWNQQSASQVVSAAATTATSSPDLWHARLGHPSLSRFQLLASQGHLGSVQFQKFDCTSYHFGKQTKLPFNKSDSFSSAPFDLIHFDIWGPAPVPTEGGSKYFVIFVDDFSRYTWIYLLHHRSELVSIYQTFHKMIETQFNRAVKVFWSDNAQEYNDKSFLSFLDSHGTLPQRSCPYTSQ